jgi:hypothetical protein
MIALQKKAFQGIEEKEKFVLAGNPAEGVVE